MLTPLLFALTLATNTVDEAVDPVAPSIFAQWLTQCAAGPRCSCLMHGVTADSETLFAAFPSVAFFVLLAAEHEAIQAVEWLPVANLPQRLQERVVVDVGGGAVVGEEGGRQVLGEEEE